VKDEFFDRVRVEDVAEARERLGCWFRHYNFTRPHQSLDGLVPADRFFAAEDPVRRAIEATLSKNELRRAIGEKPRTPVYLAGRIGDQTVSLHGEGGRLVVHTGEGDERAIEMASLGMPGTETNDDADRDDGTTETGTPPAAGEVRDAGPRGVGAGAVAVGDGGGADQGPRGGGGDPVVVAGGDAQGGSGDGAGGDAAAAVAAQPAGAVGDGGGIAQTAEEEKGDGNEPGEPGGEPGPAEEEDRHAHHGAAAGAGGGDPPAADAGVADGGGDQERWIQAFLDTLPECPRRPGNGWGAGSANRDAASGGPTSPEASA
jgi:hypothetical protein